MNDASERAFFAVVISVVSMLFGMVLGGTLSGSYWEESAKARGLMKYNESSGMLEWTVERKDVTK